MTQETVKSNEELLRRTRENAIEMALRDLLTRQFGNYEIDGARGVIRSKVPVSINYRALAIAALCHADLFDGRPLRGSTLESQP